MASESTIIYAWEISDCAELADILIRLEEGEFGVSITDSYRRGMSVFIRATEEDGRYRITKARLLKLEHPERKPTYELELE